MKTALLLEGGGMRGMYTAGVLDALMDMEVHFDAIMGVSAGALFGLNYKSRQRGRVLRYNMNYIGDKRYMGFHSFITTGDLMNRKFCFDDIVYRLDPVDFDTFNNSPEEFYAVVTNLDTGKAEYIKITDLEADMEYLRASGSLPFVSHPVEIDGKKYLDGGIADSIPIMKIIEMGFDRVLVVLTRPAGYRKKKDGGPFANIIYHKHREFANAFNTRYITYNKQLDAVAEFARDGKALVLQPTEYIKMGRIEKDKSIIRKMYDLGFENACSKRDIIENFCKN